MTLVFFRMTIVVPVLFTATLQAEPSALVVDEKAKPKVRSSHIAAVHEEIENPSGSREMARLAVLKGMLNTKGMDWLYEGEGPGYILARWDYRGDTIILRVEYNQNLIQIKYEDGNSGYECENLIEGICYENTRGYYNYLKNFRIAIVNQL